MTNPDVCTIRRTKEDKLLIYVPVCMARDTNFPYYDLKKGEKVKARVSFQKRTITIEETTQK